MSHTPTETWRLRCDFLSGMRRWVRVFSSTSSADMLAGVATWSWIGKVQRCALAKGPSVNINVTVQEHARNFAVLPSTVVSTAVQRRPSVGVGCKHIGTCINQ